MQACSRWFDICRVSCFDLCLFVCVCVCAAIAMAIDQAVLEERALNPEWARFGRGPAFASSSSASSSAATPAAVGDSVGDVGGETQWIDEGECEWMIGNHCDEVRCAKDAFSRLIFPRIKLSQHMFMLFGAFFSQLTPWFPIIASRSHIGTKFFLLPWYANQRMPFACACLSLFASVRVHVSVHVCSHPCAFAFEWRVSFACRGDYFSRRTEHS
jgi:hypothetical protein